MSSRSDFTDAEWTALTEAPLQVMVTMYAAGAHGPISTIKESTAGARAITQPGNRGAGSGLIAELVPEAQGKEARHDVGHPHGDSIDQVIDQTIDAMAPAATVLGRLGDEGAQVAAWLVDVAVAVAQAAKGITDRERDAVGRIAAAFGVAAPSLDG